MSCSQAECLQHFRHASLCAGLDGNEQDVLTPPCHSAVCCMLADLQVMREQEEDAAAAQHVAAAVEKTKVKGLSKVCMLVTHSSCCCES